jgi:hypothetical protein
MELRFRRSSGGIFRALPASHRFGDSLDPRSGFRSPFRKTK